MQYLESIVRLDCSKKEDMVSIALNTARLPLVDSGHVNTGEEVTWIMVLLTIASGDVQPLVMDGTKLKIPDNDGTRTITSWVERPKVLTIMDSKRIPHIDKDIMAITKEYIELTSYCLLICWISHHKHLWKSPPCWPRRILSRN
jgi:hypothetical protein